MRKVRRPRALAAGLAALLTATLAPAAGLAPAAARAANPSQPDSAAATTSVPVQLVSITDFHG